MECFPIACVTYHIILCYKIGFDTITYHIIHACICHTYIYTLLLSSALFCTIIFDATSASLCNALPAYRMHIQYEGNVHFKHVPNCNDVMRYDVMLLCTKHHSCLKCTLPSKQHIFPDRRNICDEHGLFQLQFLLMYKV